ASSSSSTGGREAALRRLLIDWISDSNTSAKEKIPAGNPGGWVMAAPIPEGYASHLNHSTDDCLTPARPAAPARRSCLRSPPGRRSRTPDRGHPARTVAAVPNDACCRRPPAYPDSFLQNLRGSARTRHIA